LLIWLEALDLSKLLALSVVLLKGDK